ncbi:phytase [Gallaecimonas mangrovi]|uniref:phytase n=1 Tax=Gallaecimonas mangrovi TaxID=2291597 RepID=UPI000E207240|nr:phytase [Gallaecimonas mangrovi]
MKALLTLTLLAQSALATTLPFAGKTLTVSDHAVSLGKQTLASGATERLVFSQDGNLMLRVGKADETLSIWQGANKRFSAPVTDRVVEALCSYQSVQDGNLYVFVLDDRGSGEEWLVKTQYWLKKPLKLRELNIPYKSTACATDSASGQLFISENDKGIWRYSAELEAEPTRELIDVAAPFGKLVGQTQALAVTPKGLLVRLGEQSLDLYPNATAKSAHKAALSAKSSLLTAVNSWP